MSANEIFTRTRQAIDKRSDSLRYRMGLAADVPVLRQTESASARTKFFFCTADIPAITRAISTRWPDVPADLAASAEKICSHRFDLLGYRDLDYGQDIQWHTDAVNGITAPPKPWYQIKYLEFSQVGDAKVTWELNRHQHLSILARAYLFSKQEKYLHELRSQWRSWQVANPYPIGVNWASSLEYAFRSMSWIWVLQLLSNGELAEDFRAEVLQSLALHGRNIEKYMSTYFSANTHLLGEAVALFFVGTLYPQIGAAPRWKRLGWETICEHARKKTLSDGAYFEQSTYYHVYALDMLLHARILAERNGIQVASGFDDTLRKMLEYLAGLHSGGPPARFGDDDGGRWFDGRRNRAEHLADPLCLGAVLFQEPRFKLKNAQPSEELSWLLGESAIARFEQLAERPWSTAGQSFSSAGTYIMTNSPGTVLTVDAGPLGGDSGGHGHADALSLNLTIGGKAVLADPGTFQYVGKDDQRSRFRTTQAHNTVALDGQSQAMPTSPFSWDCLPQTTVDRWTSGAGFDLFVGTHEGYKSRGAVHRRWIFNLKQRYFFICDELYGDRECAMDIAWHFTPCQVPELRDDTVSGLSGLSLVADPQHLQLCRDEYQYSPAYGQSVAASALHQTGTVRPPFASATLLHLDPRHKAIVRRFCPHDLICAYQILGPVSTETIILALGELLRPWVVENISSDADFLYVKQDECGKIVDVIAANASFARLGGAELFRRSRMEPMIELMAQESVAGADR